MHLFLLLALWFPFAMPGLDHHLTERMPLHGHLVLGSTMSQQKEALAHHQHAFQHAHSHGERMSPAMATLLARLDAVSPYTVVVTDAPQTAAPTVLEVVAGSVCTNDCVTMPGGMPSVALLWSDRALPLSRIDPADPPPPRVRS